MPQWVTDQNGVWHPAKEKVALHNYSNKAIKHPITGEMIQPGEPFIYEGPDRAALFQLYEMDKTGNTTTLGSDFKGNTEFLEFYAKMKNAIGLKDMAEFLSYLGYDEKKTKERFDKEAATIKKHELPTKVEEIKKMGGGINTVDPKQSKYGGFGVPEELATSKG